MKYVLLALSLFGCTINYSHSAPKLFHYNQPVHAYHGFYQGVEGTVTSYKSCGYESSSGEAIGTWCYDIYVNERTTVTVFEQDLVQ